MAEIPHDYPRPTAALRPARALVRAIEALSPELSARVAMMAEHRYAAIAWVAIEHAAGGSGLVSIRCVFRNAHVAQTVDLPTTLISCARDAMRAFEYPHSEGWRA